MGGSANSAASSSSLMIRRRIALSAAAYFGASTQRQLIAQFYERGCRMNSAWAVATLFEYWPVGWTVEAYPFPTFHARVGGLVNLRRFRLVRVLIAVACDLGIGG